MKLHGSLEIINFLYPMPNEFVLFFWSFLFDFAGNESFKYSLCDLDFQTSISIYRHILVTL